MAASPVARRERGEGVVRELGDHVGVVGRGRQRRHDREVHPRLLGRGQVGEHALADEVVGEAQADPARGVVEHAVVEGGPQVVEHAADPGDRRQQRRVDVAPEHRRRSSSARHGRGGGRMRARTTSRTAAGTRSAAGPARTSSPTKNGLPPERRATAATTSGSGDAHRERGTDFDVIAIRTARSASPPSARSRSAGR